MTGASGVIHAQRLVEVLLEQGREVHLVASAAALRVIREEAPEMADPRTVCKLKTTEGLRVFSEKDIGAPFCSGSFRFQGMVIVPATMGTIGAVAAGVTTNAIHRGADVTLKERRPLVVVPRETPLSAIHLENLLRLSRSGAVILPACPAYYQRPASIGDLVDFTVSRILDHLGIPNSLHARWGG